MVNPVNKQRDMTSLFTGELSAEEIELLLERAATDPEASRELDLVCDLHAAAESEQSLLLDSIAPTEGPRHLPRRNSLRIAAGITGLAAAAMLLWLGLRTGGIQSPEPSSETVAVVESVPPAYVPLELRAADTNLAERFRAAMEGYTLRDWPRTVSDLTGFMAQSPEHAPALFYRAAAHEALGDDSAAAEDYRASAASAAGPVSEHARWRLAQLEIRLGHVDMARVLLNQLLDSRSSFALNAEALLSDLDR